MIPLKSPSEIGILRENGKRLARVLESLCAEVAPDVDTASLDQIAEGLIREAGGEPAFKGYRGYPASICTSINHEVVHGIPSPRRHLREGDILSIDIGLLRDGLYADVATTVPVGKIGESARHLLRVTEEGLWRGIERATIGARLSDVSHAIGSYVESEGLYVVTEYVGHGVGRQLHEDPQIPNYGRPGRGPRLQAGMVLAIEPMVKTDPEPTRVLDDRWTVVTGNGGLAAHFEHTIVLTETGVDVVTQGGDGRRSGQTR
ncbi:MAG: type I methionyl aminopeptidase [Candidatus Bipolaricaulota bacterium]|jgi:methionyl aminopeptidase|nr:type I methionyl aminopeptidase [Candidatus Bipolaricaulota bacterium]